MTKKRRISFREKAKKQRRSLYMAVVAAALFFSILSSWVLADNGIDSVTVTVDSGDTLWAVCSRYLPENTDIRDFIEKVKYINKLKSSNLSIGTELVIPTRQTHGCALAQ